MITLTAMVNIVFINGSKLESDLNYEALFLLSFQNLAGAIWIYPQKLITSKFYLINIFLLISKN